MDLGIGQWIYKKGYYVILTTFLLFLRNNKKKLIGEKMYDSSHQ